MIMNNLVKCNNVLFTTSLFIVFKNFLLAKYLCSACIVATMLGFVWMEGVENSFLKLHGSFYINFDYFNI